MQIQTVKLLLLLNIFGFGAICLLTFFLSKGAIREKILGYICMTFALSVFAAPLFIVVIKTHSFIFAKRVIHRNDFEVHIFAFFESCFPFSQRKVIKTKSVEYMPFTLSFFLTIGAVAWFFYGLLIKDLNVAVSSSINICAQCYHLFFIY